MKRTIGIGCAVAGLLFICACGGSGGSSNGGGGGGSSDTPSITSIGALPKATSPMASGASANAAKDATKAATTGMSLATTSADSFSASSSRGACEMFNQLRQSINSASNADKILCYVGNMQSAFENAGTNLNVYDGAWHVLNLNMIQCSSDADCRVFLPDGSASCTNNACTVGGQPIGGAPDRVKMRIQKNAAGSITSFEMFMCLNQNGSSRQNEYTRETIDGAIFSMRGIGQHGGSGSAGWHVVDVSGTLNANSTFTAKTIRVRNSDSEGNNSHAQDGTLTQTPGLFSFSGFQYGANSSDAGSGTYSNRVYGLGELLNDSSTDLTKLAMGDGAVNYLEGGTFDNGHDPVGTYSGEGREAWSGDTIALMDTNEFLAGAEAGTLPAVGDVSPAFASDELWDCSDDVGSGIVDLPQTNESELTTACSAYTVNDRDWINCYELIPNQQN